MLKREVILGSTLLDIFMAKRGPNNKNMQLRVYFRIIQTILNDNNGIFPTAYMNDGNSKYVNKMKKMDKKSPKMGQIIQLRG